MICFHFIIFEPSETTIFPIPLPVLCCDLLSFHYLWAIRNNSRNKNGGKRVVVICFHFIIFEPSETTNNHYLCHASELWFAFISLSLSHQKQLFGFRLTPSFCCDLLSFHYLWAIRNNIRLSGRITLIVVICFHFIIFEPSETTEKI